VLTREEKARGGRVRAANAWQRKLSLRHDLRGSERLVEAAQRLEEISTRQPAGRAVGGQRDLRAHLPPVAEVLPVKDADRLEELERLLHDPS
jgi:hypothetical protein